MDTYVTDFLSRLFRASQNVDSINLAIGQPNFKPPECVLNELKKNIGSYTKYTDVEGLPELRALIQKKLIIENKIKAEKIIVTNGAVEAIFDTMLTYLNRDSEIILFSPYYGKYKTVPKLFGSKIKKISLNNNNRPDFETLKQSITKKTRMIIVNSPCNPTGVVFSRDEVKRLIEIVEKHDLILLSDEVYEKYVYDRKEHVSPGQYSDNVITINSFSKTYSLPGLRLGYLAGTSNLVDPILDIHMSNTTCSSYASQMAAIRALKLKKNCFDLSSFDRRRKLSMNILNDNEIEYIYPEGAFYLYIYVHQDSVSLAQRLLNNKLLVMPSKLFGDVHNAVRISYATDKETLEKGLELLINNIKQRAVDVYHKNH